jgi:ABC-type multidrug transport system fused ATPase/permease subunit
MAKLDPEVFNLLLEKGASGNLPGLIALTARASAEQEAFVEKHRTLLTVGGWALSLITAVSLASYGLFAVGIVLALLTVISWQTAGIFLGVALIALFLNAVILRPLVNRVEPLYKTLRRIRAEEKVAKFLG